MALAEGSSVERIEAAFLGRIAGLRHSAAGARCDRRRAPGPHRGAGEPGQRPVDGRSSAGSSWRRSGSEARDFTRADPRHGRLRRAGASRVAGNRDRTSRVARTCVEAWGRRLDDRARAHVTMFRYEDLPGMIGRVGTIFGEHGINIVLRRRRAAPADGERRRASSRRWSSPPTRRSPRAVVERDRSTATASSPAGPSDLRLERAAPRAATRRRP